MDRKIAIVVISLLIISLFVVGYFIVKQDNENNPCNKQTIKEHILSLQEQYSPEEIEVITNKVYLERCS